MRDLLQRLYQTKMYKKYHQFVKFGIVGVTNFLVSLVVYYLVLWIFSQFPDGYHSTAQLIIFIFHYDYQIANILAFIISVLNAYFLNRFWVFHKEAKKSSNGAILRFFISYGVTFLLSLLLAWVWVELFSISKTWVPFLNAAIMTPINYFLSKYFAFREKKNSSTPCGKLPVEN